MGKVFKSLKEYYDSIGYNQEAPPSQPFKNYTGSAGAGSRPGLTSGWKKAPSKKKTWKEAYGLYSGDGSGAQEASEQETPPAFEDYLAQYQGYDPQIAQQYAKMDQLDAAANRTQSGAYEWQKYQPDEVAAWRDARSKIDRESSYRELDKIYDKQVESGLDATEQELSGYSPETLEAWWADRQILDTYGLDRNVLDIVREQWHEKLYPDKSDPEDDDRVEAGGIPKNLAKNYDLSNPVEKFLYDNDLPYLSEFNKRYESAVDEYNKQIGETNAANQEEYDYQVQLNGFRERLYQAMYDAQSEENAAASAEGRTPEQIDPEAIIAGLLNSGEYDLLADYFREAEEKGETDTYDSIIAGVKERKQAEDLDPRIFTQQDLLDEYMGLASGMQAAYDAEERGASASPYALPEVSPEEIEAVDAAIAAIDAQIAALGLADVDAASAAVVSNTMAVAQPTEEELQAAYEESYRTGESADLILLRQQQEKADGAIAKLAELRAQREELIAQREALTSVRNKASGERDIYAAVNLFRAQYASLTQEPDYEDKSQPLTSGIDGDVAKIERTIQNANKGDASHATLGKYENCWYMTTDEVGVFRYLVRTKGADAAVAFIEDITPILNNRRYTADHKFSTGLAEKYGALASIGSMFQLLGSSYEGLSQLVGGALAEVTDGRVGRKLAYQDPRSSGTNIVEDTRARRREIIVNTTGEEWRGFVYDIAMSVGDNALRALTIGKLGALGIALSSTAVGSQVASSTISKYMESGASSKQALCMGALAAGCEALGELFDLSTLFKLSSASALAKAASKSGKALSAGKLVGSYMLSNAVTETGSEAVTELATFIADLIVMGDQSEIETIYNTAKSQGMTNGQAFFEVIKKMGVDIGAAGLGGLISGLVLGGGNLTLIMSEVGKGAGAPAGKRFVTGARVTADNVMSTVELQDALTQEYQITLEDGTAKDAFARIQIMDDIAALGLDEETTEQLNVLADQFASSPAALMSPQAMDALDTFQQAVHNAASRVRLLDADASVKQAKARQRLQRLYDSAAQYQQDARTALESGNLAAHTKAMNKLTTAIGAYNSATETAQTETVAQDLKYKEAKKVEVAKVEDAAQALEELAPKEKEHQYEQLSVAVADRVGATVADRIGAEQQAMMRAMVESHARAEAESPAEAAKAAKAANTRNRKLIHDVSLDTIDLAIEKAQMYGEHDAANKLRAYREIVASNVPLQATIHETREALNIIDRLLNPNTEVIRGKDGPAHDGLMDMLVNGEDLDQTKDVLNGEDAEAIDGKEIDAIIKEMVNGGKTDGEEGQSGDGADGGRSETRADGVPVDQPGRNDDGTPQRTDAGGLREPASGNESEDSSDTEARRVDFLDRWDEATAQKRIDGFVKSFNKTRGKGSPKLANDSVSYSNAPSTEDAGKALSEAHKFLGGERPLLFNVEKGAQAMFGVASERREYVRDTGNDLVSFYFGHERAHNRSSVRDAALGVLEAFGGEKSSMFLCYCAAFNEHPTTKAEREHLQTEFACDAFGAYVYTKATGKDISSRLGLSESEAEALFNAFDKAMGAKAYLEETDSGRVGAKVKTNPKTGAIEFSLRSMEQDRVHRQQLLQSVEDVSKGMSFSDHDMGDNGPSTFITRESLDELRTIPVGTNLNDLSSEQLEKTRPFARVLWENLREKSPFFKAWFGDWREYDTAPLSIAVVERGVPRSSGRAINFDTGRALSWGRSLFGETKSHLQSGGIASEISGSIQSIVENAVLFDTEVSGKTSGSKLDGTAFMHHFYSIVDDAGELSLMKLYAEEAIPRNGGEPFSRAYMLKDIRKITALTNSVLLASKGLTDASTAIDINVAELFALVKEFDPAFSASGSVSKELLDTKGKPKILYHGTRSTFNRFMPDYRGAIWFTDNKIIASGYAGNSAKSKTPRFFARIENPMVVTFGFDENWDIDRTVRNAKAAGHDGIIIKFANPKLRENSYYQFVLENMPETPAAEVFKTIKNAPPAQLGGNMTIAEFDATLGADGEVYEYVVAFDPKQVKSADSNIGTFDRTNPEYGFSTHDLGTSEEAVPSRQTTALDLFDRGMDAADYYREASANGTFDQNVAAELSGIRLRNGLAEGGRLSNAEMQSIAEDMPHWLKQSKLLNAFKAPLRVMQDMGQWHDNKTNEGLMRNMHAREYYTDRLFGYRSTQMAFRAQYVAGKLQAVQAVNASETDSAMAQIVGEGVVSEATARRAITDGKHILIPIADGAIVLDKKGRRRMLLDHTSLFRLDGKDAKKAQPGRHSVKIANGRASITDGKGRTILEMYGAKPAYTARAQKLQSTLRGIYDEMYTMYQSTLVSNGYAPAGRRQDYFPHIGEKVDGLNAVIEFLHADDLPIEIAGLTDTFTPGKPWAANLLTRLGEDTAYDAVRGFNGYVNKIADVIFLTPVVQRYRQFEEALRYGVEGADGERTEVSQDNSAMAVWFHEQANHLASKNSALDRGAETVFDRQIFKISCRLSGIVGTAKIAGNLATAFAQLVPFAQNAGQMRPKYVVRGIRDASAARINGYSEDGLESRLPFLVNRLTAADQVITNMGDRFKQSGMRALFALMEAVDRFSTTSVARAKYYELMESGLTDEQALKKTDDYCMQLFADRSKGSKPTVFNSKVASPLTQFQLELTNQLWHYRDIHQENVLREYERILRRNNGEIDGIDFAAMENQINRLGIGWKDAAQIIGRLVALSLFGILARWAKGSDSAFNPYGTAKDLIEDYSDGGMEALLEGLGDVAKDNLPFLSMGDRGIPLTQGAKDIGTAISDMREASKDAEDGGNYDVWDGLVNPALSIAATVAPGGAQLKKTVSGLHANAEGGSYSATGRMRYPIDRTGQRVRSVLFGPSAAAPKGYSWGQDVLSAKGTEAYDQLVDEGYDDRDVYDLMLSYNGKSKETKALSLAMGAEDFTPRELDHIADTMGIKYDHKKDGPVIEWAVEMARADLDGLEEKVKDGEVEQSTFDEYSDIYDDYFRQLGIG